MTQRYSLALQYDGTGYAGWQKQPNAETVQETIEQSLTKLNSHQKVNLVGCGRTDAGVHANYYVAHFDFNKDLEPLDLMFKLNKMLPNDIAILECQKVDEEFHARFSAVKRGYDYYIHFKKNAFINRYSYYSSQIPDIELMNEAAGYLIGKQDFECFSKVKTDVTHFECIVFNAQWRPDKNGLVFHIEANRFLRNMVRAIVGSLLDIGYGNHPPDHMKTIIRSKDRQQAGESVPACGLYLSLIEY